MMRLRWPRSLFARLGLLLCLGVAVAQGLSFWLTMRERNEATTNMMMGYIEREVATSVALLDALPAAQRAAWLPRLQRRSYEFRLEACDESLPHLDQLQANAVRSFEEGIGKQYQLTVHAIPGAMERYQVHLALGDGTPLTIDFRPMRSVPMSPWFGALMAAQLAVFALCCWLAVRLATRPLQQLALAADALGPDMQGAHLPENGPSEVARAARAFNAMQQRIAGYMAERIQILASISHDLQTPITRMRLRVDMMDDEPQQARLRQDLQAMEQLVKEGVAYARTLHGTSEAPTRIDPDALLDSMVHDYTDAGQEVSLHGAVGRAMELRPQALRRVLGNLIDNALKFGGSAQVHVAQAGGAGGIAISVLDRGPGIPPESLQAVFEPFVRLESSRSRETGGTGLGLAIARQLATAMGGTLTLHPREGGGLEARLALPG
ncbi:ATP-binding protein [Massilia sp. SR12]